MARIFIDTHVWVWGQFEPHKLPNRVHKYLTHTETILVSSASVYEIGQKLRIGKWPNMSIEKLDDMINFRQTYIEIMPLDAGTLRSASLVDWSHRDPFDRMIAASALEHDCALVSKDSAFDAVSGLTRIWG